MSQRGFLSLGPTGYMALAAGAVIVGLGIAVKVQSARLAASQQENKALAQQVSQWTAAAKECSDATKKAAEEAAKRARNAAIALEQARKSQASSKAEIDRLRGLIGSKPVGECPAGQAARAVRESLQK